MLMRDSEGEHSELSWTYSMLCCRHLGDRWLDIILNDWIADNHSGVGSVPIFIRVLPQGFERRAHF